MSAVAAWLRVWSKRFDEHGRKDTFAYLLTLSLTALPIEGLMAVVLVFMTKGVVFTWKFSITLFGFMLVADLIRLPLIVYLIKPRRLNADSMGDIETV